MEKAIRFAAILFVFTVVLCIFCYQTGYYQTTTRENTTTSAVETESVEDDKTVKSDETPMQKAVEKTTEKR